MTYVRPYTYHRIKQILKDDYGLELQRIYLYKGERHGTARYNLVHEDGSVELLNITLHGLRVFLTQKDYPLKNE